ncbi:SPOR domain-containing protein [Lewinella sp. LCG006]|uniref:SPOR domain-containing protein n=1 Tax=Lewinella sp. LCG006 TaxID=3231911 RepID=UPI0034600910
MMNLDPATALNLILGGILLGVIIFARLFAFALGNAWRRERYQEHYSTGASFRGGLELFVLFGILLLIWWSWAAPKESTSETSPDSYHRLESLMEVSEGIEQRSPVLYLSAIPVEEDFFAGSSFYLQVAAYENEPAATLHLAKLLEAGHPAEIRFPRAEDARSFWRVWIGPFLHREAVDSYQQQHQLKGLIREEFPHL